MQVIRILPIFIILFNFVSCNEEHAKKQSTSKAAKVNKAKKAKNKTKDGAAFFVPKKIAKPKPKPNCKVSKDCKIIFSSCNCLSVTIKDKRSMYVGFPPKVCRENICRRQNISAICIKRRCRKSQKTFRE